jgi:hypothetical protein
LNPARPPKFDVEADYPRWLPIRDRKDGTAEKVRPTGCSSTNCA